MSGVFELAQTEKECTEKPCFSDMAKFRSHLLWVTVNVDCEMDAAEHENE